MKNIIFCLLLLPVLGFSNNKPNPGLEAISTALNTGDMATLSKYFAEEVEISIADNEQTYNKTKAIEVVKGFFETNKPKGFSQIHKGSSRENNDQYCIGNLTASTGVYRVYLYLKVSGDAVSIQEMRFDKE